MSSMKEHAKPTAPSQRRYPKELKIRAVRMVHEATAEAGGNPQGVVTRIARQLGVGDESLRNWVKQPEIEPGTRPGMPRADAKRLRALVREVRELRRANEILKASAAFFARELDSRLAR
jgi:transposase